MMKTDGNWIGVTIAESVIPFFRAHPWASNLPNFFDRTSTKLPNMASSRQ